jgi:nitrile hydratase
MAHDDAAISQRVRALETELERLGVVDGTTLDGIIDQFLAKSTPRQGAQVIARAWLDEEFRSRLLADGNAAIGELGLSMTHGPMTHQLKVVQNTELVHNVVVCTLCSCYPLALLGPSPSWYKSEAYRARVVRWPREVLAEFGFEPSAETEIRVWDSSAETRYLVIPRRPAGTENATEEELASLVTRAGMIGTAAV